MKFQHDTQAFLTGKPPASPQKALSAKWKSPPHHRRPPFGCPNWHTATQPTKQGVGKGIPYFFKSS